MLGRALLRRLTVQDSRPREKHATVPREQACFRVWRLLTKLWTWLSGSPILRVTQGRMDAARSLLWKEYRLKPIPAPAAIPDVSVSNYTCPPLLQVLGLSEVVESGGAGGSLGWGGYRSLSEAIPLGRKRTLAFPFSLSRPFSAQGE